MKPCECCNQDWIGLEGGLGGILSQLVETGNLFVPNTKPAEWQKPNQNRRQECSKNIAFKGAKVLNRSLKQKLGVHGVFNSV